MREFMLIIHFIGIAMFIGTGFAFLFLEVSNSKLPKSELIKFSLNILPLGKMGRLGLLLLVISGGYLMTPYWSVLGNMPLLITKLIAVLLISITIVIMAIYSKKAKKDKTDYYLKKIEPYSKLSFLLGFVILILATYTFY